MTLKAAVIGCGRMGGVTLDHLKSNLPESWLPLAHAEALSEIDDVELVAVCDVSLEKALAVASDLGNIPTYDNHQNMLANHRIDLIGVATRTKEREEIILHCLAAGVKGIHAEKPLALSMTATNNILDSVKQHGASLTIGTVRRFMPIYQHCLALIQDGIIGTVNQVAVEHGHDLLFWGHPHSLDLMIMMLESHDIVDIQVSSTQIDPTDFQDNCLDLDPRIDAAIVRFGSGKSGIITQGSGCNLHMYGSAGTLTIRNDGEYIELRRKNETGYLEAAETIFVDDKTSGTKSAFLQLQRVQMGGTETFQSLLDIETVQTALATCAWSVVKGGTTVSPNDVPANFRVTGKFNGNYP